MTYEDFVAKHTQCWCCGAKGSLFYGQPGVYGHLEIHHMVCGVNRAKAADDPRTWFRACVGCHQGKDGLHNYAVWPIARQLAYKKEYDAENYDRVFVNRMRGRADEAITEEEVDAWEVT